MRYLGVCLLLLAALSACKPPLREAESLLQKGRYQAAEKTLNQLLQDKGSNPDAEALLGQALFYTQGPELAMQHLQALYPTHQDDRTYRQVVQALKKEFALLDQLVRKGTVAELLDYLKQEHPDWLKERAQWLLLQKNQLEDGAKFHDPLITQLVAWHQAGSAVGELKNLLAVYPKSRLQAAWYQALAELNWKAQNKAQAIDWLREAEKDLPERSLRQAGILLKRANYEIEAEQFGAALKDSRQFLKLFPKHPAGRQVIYALRDKLKPYLRTSDHRFLAEQAFAREMYQTAYAELSQVPASEAAEIYRLGDYALRAKLWTPAREQFVRLQKNFKGSLEAGLASVGLASIQRSQKAYAQALQNLHGIKTAYGSNPEVLAAALWEQGLVHDFQNRDDLRSEAYHQLLKVDPGFSEAMSALWYALWHDYRQGDYQQVIDLVSEHRRYFAKHELKSRFEYWQARAYEQLAQTKEAKEIYLELSKNPLMDYYAHRARERLRLLERGGEDRYATAPYTGYTRARVPDPGYEQAFEAYLSGDTEAFSELMELYYLRHPAFMNLAAEEEQPRYQVLHGMLLHAQGRHYEAITRYRYPAESDDAFLPAAFPLAFFDSVEAEAKKNGLNPFLVSGQIWQESQYKPDIRSWVGATGLMQIMPATGAQIAQNLGLDKNYSLVNPATNIRMGSWYLKSRHDVFDGNPLFAVASYNAGAGPVMRWKNEFGSLPYDAQAESITYPETRGYVKRVFTSYWIYQSLYGK